MPAEAPPAAAPSGVKIVESPVIMPKPTTKTISVSEMSRSTQGAPPPKEAATAEPPKRGSAKDKMFGDLRKKAKDAAGNLVNQEPDPKDSAALPAKPSAEPAATPPTAGEPPVSPGESTTQPAKTKDGKVNPWHLVDEYKKKIGELETQQVELGKRAIPEAKWKEMESELTKFRTRAQELEGEIRYVDYTKSEEFKTKYQQPYEAAWHRANSELSEINVEDGNGGSRPANQNDMMELVNAKLGDARKIADEKFGPFANEAMAHRKDIRKLYDEQTAALETARKDAGEREKQRNEQTSKVREQMSTELLTSWKSANDEVMADTKHGKYFQPIEGDAEGNQRLAKGFELADRAFSESPSDPKLTPEQRREVIKRHAAVRLRAAAYGRLRAQNEAFEGRIAALTKELEQYKGSEPAMGGSRETSPATGNGTAMDRMKAELRKIAK